MISVLCILMRRVCDRSSKSIHVGYTLGYFYIPLVCKLSAAPPKWDSIIRPSWTRQPPPELQVKLLADLITKIRNNCLLSEELNTVRNNPQQISVFCAFWGPPDPRSLICITSFLFSLLGCCWLNVCEFGGFCDQPSWRQSPWFSQSLRENSGMILKCNDATTCLSCRPSDLNSTWNAKLCRP